MGSPPLKATKPLFSWAVAEGVGCIEGGKNEGMTIDFVDLRRAYFHAGFDKKSAQYWKRKTEKREMFG